MKKTLNYNDREKKWAEYHKYENAQRRGYLKKLSERDSIKILEGLYRCAYSLKFFPNHNKLDTAKIEILASVHSIFRKVKA